MSATVDIKGALKKSPRGLTKARSLELLRAMMRCRRFEERVQELFQSGELKGTSYRSVRPSRRGCLTAGRWHASVPPTYRCPTTTGSNAP